MDWSAGACRGSGWRPDREVHRAVWGVLLAALHRELQRGSLLRPLHQVLPPSFPCRHVFISLCVLSMPCYPPPHRPIIIISSSCFLSSSQSGVRHGGERQDEHRPADGPQSRTHLQCAQVRSTTLMMMMMHSLIHSFTHSMIDR